VAAPRDKLLFAIIRLAARSHSANPNRTHNNAQTKDVDDARTVCAYKGLLIAAESLLLKASAKYNRLRSFSPPFISFFIFTHSCERFISFQLLILAAAFGI
jgi:hypothetical protein